MRALVIFDTVFGNTERVAHAIADALEGYGEVRLEPVETVAPTDFAGIDLLILGGPTQGHGATRGLRDVLKALGAGTLSGVPAATFDTRIHWPRLLSGSAAMVAEHGLEAAGCRMIAEGETFFVRGREGPLDDGEIQHARAWAEDLVARLDATETANRP